MVKMSKETRQNLKILAVFIIVISLIMAGYFWFNMVPKSDFGYFDCNPNGYFFDGYDEYCKIVFDNHGIPNIFYIVFSIIALELVYIGFLLTKKKSSRESWADFVVGWKFASLGILILIYSSVSLIFYLCKIWYILVICLGVIGAVVVYYLINKGLAKLIAKERKWKKRIR